MCGIFGIHSLKGEKIPNLEKYLRVANEIQRHRGPDDAGTWKNRKESTGFAHRRLTIIDLKTGSQPMTDSFGNTIIYNGEIYNYIELRDELETFYEFRTTSDTEAILASYRKWGLDCLDHLRGMFAFAIWDDSKKEVFCARDRFGIKPFYYTVTGDTFYFASEAKTLLPFVNEIKTNPEALKEYLVFQFCLDGKTLFEGVNELLPAHFIRIKNGNVENRRYWEVYFKPDFHHTQKYFTETLRNLIEDSVKIHLRADVPAGAYLSGGADSSIVASVASKFRKGEEFVAFNGRFSLSDLYDESRYARVLAEEKGLELKEIDVTSRDFVETIGKVIYHLDFPVAGPGSFPQFHVSKLASQYRKVVLGGQGGDEIFGGYVRYLIAYFEQCIKAAIDGTVHSGNFIVTYESIIPNLVALRNYKSLMQEFWKEGLFEEMDDRYYRLINRAHAIKDEVNWEELRNYKPFETFKKVFNRSDVDKESYFDKMTHFDFKTLLPALLQVEDRMSMAHGLESRVPFLDHPVVEFAATMPSNIKFKDGTLKMSLINSMRDYLPKTIANRKNKMGFPVPLNEWLKGDLKGFFLDLFGSKKAKQRMYYDSSRIIEGLEREPRFGRKLWGFLSLELWCREFHDKSAHYKKLTEH